jgi:magnesium transporter
MNAGKRERLDPEPSGLQRVELDGELWLHALRPDTEALTALEPGLSPPTAVLDTLRTPPPRPQRIDVGAWTLWALRTVRFESAPAAVTAGHLVIAVGPTVVITAGQLPEATHRWTGEQGPGHDASPPSAGARLVTRILDDLLDDVGRVVADLDDEVEDIEAAVFTPGRASHAERIYRLKREVQTVRRCVGPLPELLSAGTLTAGGVGTTEVPSVQSVLVARSRRLVEQLSHVDDLLDSVLTAHLTQVAIRQNDDMRRISAWVAIVAAPTAMASIYGMNFRFMPELGWRYGYPLVLLTMLAVSVGLYRLFRRSGWL